MTTRFTRRGFAGTLAAAALAPLIRLPIHGDPAPARNAAPQPPDPSAEAQAFTEALKARYGDQLGADDLKVIADQVQSGLHRAARLQSVELGNGDEPDFVFAPPALRRTTNAGGAE
ncbi:MAG TPA: hypothetical protein VFL95_07240 [Gemmatimonadales bacterium]|nr:hypothetical protein [Gemmatimonadales bacterium]